MLTSVLLLACFSALAAAAPTVEENRGNCLSEGSPCDLRDKLPVSLENCCAPCGSLFCNGHGVWECTDALDCGDLDGVLMAFLLF